MELENRMVADIMLWQGAHEPEIHEKVNGSAGYSEVGTGVFVPEEEAFEYAMERVSLGTDKEKQEFVEWFYSGNWVKEYGEKAHI